MIDVTRGYNLAGKILTLHVNKSSSILDDSINILYYKYTIKYK